ncbi:hypothetical protein HYS47_00770 [Candidatus Woesearchaeota archaeon]|nr:hypothetical protein [Candidatus Woesearchaeota archaeon]
MTLDVAIPTLGKHKQTTRSMVISALLYEHPLTLIRLTNVLHQQFGASVTFQGVRKAVQQLITQDVIVKQEKNYELNKEWIKKVREFAEQLYETYFTDRSGVKEIQSIGDDVKVYTFDNLIDLDKFWNRTVVQWFADDTKNTKEKSYVQLSGHTWYVFGQLEEETSILEKIKKRGITFYTLVNGTTFLDGWCKKYYKDQGFYYTTNRDKKKGANNRYFAVYGDFIIQTTYPEGIARKIDAVYNSTRNFESFDAVKLINILRHKTELKVMMMKNPVVAEQLRHYILSHFKK